MWGGGKSLSSNWLPHGSKGPVVRVPSSTEYTGGTRAQGCKCNNLPLRCCKGSTGDWGASTASHPFSLHQWLCLHFLFFPFFFFRCPLFQFRIPLSQMTTMRSPLHGEQRPCLRAAESEPSAIPGPTYGHIPTYGHSRASCRHEVRRGGRPALTSRACNAHLPGESPSGPSLRPSPAGWPQPTKPWGPRGRKGVLRKQEDGLHSGIGGQSPPGKDQLQLTWLAVTDGGGAPSLSCQTRCHYYGTYGVPACAKGTGARKQEGIISLKMGGMPWAH